MAETKKKETREQLILVTLAALWECYWGNLSHRLLSRLIHFFSLLDSDWLKSVPINLNLNRHIVPIKN